MIMIVTITIGFTDCGKYFMIIYILEGIINFFAPMYDLMCVVLWQWC